MKKRINQNSMFDIQEKLLRVLHNFYCVDDGCIYNSRNLYIDIDIYSLIYKKNVGIIVVLNFF